MNIKQHIPNILTLGNLFCGCVGIVFVMNGFLFSGFWLMIIAAVLDFFDGFVARLLNVSGELGAQLDSLADAVTFGVLPSIIMYSLLLHQTDNLYLPFTAFIIALMSVYRLAKFNIDTEQTENFKGLAVPLNAIFIASFGVIENPILELNAVTLITISIIVSILLVSNFPMLALKFKTFGWKENQAKFILVIFSIILLFVFKLGAIPLILPLYLILSFLHFKLKII